MSNDAPATPAGGPLAVGTQDDVTPGYRTYVLVVLTLVYVVNYLTGRSLESYCHRSKRNSRSPIRNWACCRERRSRWSMPCSAFLLAIVADRVNLRNVVAASLAAFSLMTVLSGYATQYWQLLLTRFGTGIGEAEVRARRSILMLADFYPPEKRASLLFRSIRQD